MGAPYSGMELASFLTCSKGWAAECGLRSGYVELVNLQPRVRHAFNTARAVMQCPTVLGQCVLDCVVSKTLKFIKMFIEQKNLNVTYFPISSYSRVSNIMFLNIKYIADRII